MSPRHHFYMESSGRNVDSTSAGETLPVKANVMRHPFMSRSDKTGD